LAERLQQATRLRFVRLKVRDIRHGDRVAARAIVMQQKTFRPVQFEITESTREAVAAWIKEAGLRSEDYLFPSRLHESLHLSTWQYAHIVDSWVEEIGLDPADYGTHSMRRTKASLIYRRTKNLPSSCWVTPSSRAPFGTSALRSMMPWNWQSRPRCD
jgi:hypothetical protein